MLEWRQSIAPLYEVSERGDVRNLKSGRVMAVVTVRKRPYVCLRVDGKATLFQVHRLVAWAFHGPKPDKNSQVCHRDGDKWHNHFSNLYWGTLQTNAADKVRLGEVRGVRNGRCRLAPEDVLAIAASKGIESDKKTAARYGVGTATVSHIRTGKNWSHLTGIEFVRHPNCGFALALEALARKRAKNGPPVKAG